MIAPVTFPLFQPLYPFFSTTLPSTSPNYLTPPPKQSPPPLHIQLITDVSSNPKLSQYKISYSHSPSHSHSSSTPSLHTTTLPFPSLPASTPLPPPPPLHIQLVTNFSSKHIPLATSTSHLTNLTNLTNLTKPQREGEGEGTSFNRSLSASFCLSHHHSTQPLSSP